jgi:hypothetical protein
MEIAVYNQFVGSVAINTESGLHEMNRESGAQKHHNYIAKGTQISNPNTGNGLSSNPNTGNAAATQL